ncbi:MAG: isoprenylcysteine carboxylmethyltransferase family protein [Bacteroidetes bacterium]|nr:isoprenylcysteine carboxylmethyltransferase family protein [Bacteroidota bacterium]
MRVLPPVYFLMAIIIMVSLHFFAPITIVVTSPWNLLGVLPAGVALILMLYAAYSFKRAQTTIKPFQESSALVTSGVYSFTRNPMYLSMGLILVGIAIWLGSLSSWIIIIPFIFLITRVFIGTEEKMLAETFGSDYEEYRLRVRRWI